MRIKRDISVFFSTAFVFLIVFAHTSVAQNTEFDYPDLTVSSAEFSFSGDNKYLILKIEIANLGNINSENFLVSVENPGDEWPETQFEFPEVNVRESVIQEFKLEIPDKKRKEWINLRINIDPQNEITELFE